MGQIKNSFWQNPLQDKANYTDLKKYLGIQCYKILKFPNQNFLRKIQDIRLRYYLYLVS